jgi:hypothetical protein
MSARIHDFVTKEMKLQVMLMGNDAGPTRLVGGHTRSAGVAACRLSERTLTYAENPPTRRQSRLALKPLKSDNAGPSKRSETRLNSCRASIPLTPSRTR